MSKFIRSKLLPVALFAAGFIIFFGAFGITVHAAPLTRTERSLEVCALGKTYRFYYPEIDVCGGEYYLKNAENVVDGIFKDTVVRPKSAEYTVNVYADNAITYTKEKNGIGVNREELLKNIFSALKTGEKSVTAPTEVLKPQVTVADLKNVTELVSSFSTEYKTSGEARKKNIALAAEFIGFKVVKSGGEFSFNEIVGKRSEERGFAPSVVIENGKFAEGVGGGVCQVSSTVYACALQAGMTVTERRNHSLMVGYTNPGYDAMVSSASDLKFINPTKTPVIVVADADGNRIRVRIYGKKTDAEYKLASVVSEYIEPPAEQLIETSDLPAGERSAFVNAKRGARSQTYLEIYSGGKLLQRKKISSDYYSPLGGITLVGKPKL